MAKLETVDISFFRGIRDLSIKPLGHINLVVGVFACLSEPLGSCKLNHRPINGEPLN